VSKSTDEFIGRKLKKKTTTTVYKKVVETVEEFGDADSEEEVVLTKRRKRTLQKTIDDEADLAMNSLSQGVQDISVLPEVEEDSGDEFAREIEAHFLEDPSDDQMQDVGTKNKTEQELVDEAWAVFDKAIAEDPSAIPEPEPRVVENKLRMPQSTTRKRGNDVDSAEVTPTRAKFVIKLDVSFDMSHAPKHLQSQNHHYYVRGRDATTIKDMFETLWLENHEWIIFNGYSLKRLHQVKRLEITLLIKEGGCVKNTHRWSIKGDFGGKEQCEAWEAFLQAARAWGRGEAMDQLRMGELDKKRKRKRYVKDSLGNFYDHTGSRVVERNCSVHAQVDAEIVLHFN
jgi:hypothetical protein